MLQLIKMKKLFLILFFFIFGCSEYQTKKLLENCADKKTIDWRYNYNGERIAWWSSEYKSWKKTKEGDIEAIIRFYQGYNEIQPSLNSDMKIFIAKPLDKKLFGSYEKDFINCEEEMNNAEIAFKEKWRKKPKINYPPENLKWESLEKLINDKR